MTPRSTADFVSPKAGPSPLVARLRSLASSQQTAVQDACGERTFAELFDGALRARAALCGEAETLAGKRVILLVSPGARWIEAFLGVILGGGVAVPLSPLYPPAELAWFADDADADFFVFSEDLEDRAEALAAGRRALRVEALGDEAPRDSASIDAIDGAETALLLYTSGTTGKPKGARISHRNVAQQAALLRDAWGVGESDVLVHALPLHHLHGLGISLMTALLAGARTRMLPKFDAARVWDELGRGATAWMAVPTMYFRLFEVFDAADQATQARWAEGARSLRLATSGSAALPVTLADRWRALTGAIPLERFGMTEIGVGMSNPLSPDRRRRGSVGLPLPTVESRIIDDEGNDSIRGPGELWVRGPSVFPGYFRREEATQAAFVDGWFRTGDVAIREADGYVRLLGRTSVDILKSGGEKISALEVEETLRDMEAIAEVSVVGVPDATWGDRVVAVIVPRAGRAAECGTESVRAWSKARMAAHKVPREVVVVDALPRNAVGKVLKPELIKRLAAR